MPESLDAFDGHLRKIAEAAQRWTPRLLSISPRVDEGRTVVYVRMDTCTTAVFLRLIATMEAFCQREGIPPDYLFSYSSPLPGSRPTPPRAGDLPTAWPPDAP